MNKPLTIEELKALKTNDWVWIKTNDDFFGNIERYVQKIYVQDRYGFNTDFAKFHYRHYGKKWLAYKNKEQAEAKGEIVKLPCKVGDIIFVPYVYKGVSDIMRLPVDEIRIVKHAIEFCTDFDTDDEVFAIKFNNGKFLLGNFGDMWFTNKSKAEARLKELRGEK